MSEQGTAGLLATVPLLDGIDEGDLAELAGLMRRRDLVPGDVLWREGEEATALYLIAAGRVSVSLRLPGERTVEVFSLGPGEMLGEIPLLDGGRHPTSARVAEHASVLSLSRTDFMALVSRRHPTAFTLKRRIAGIACARLRLQLAALAASLPDARTRPREPASESSAAFADLEFCGPPHHGYVRRLATFRAFDSLALWGFLTAGRFAKCPAGRTVVPEGTVSTACYLTMNGAVEKVIVRGGRRIRVGLAGPGQAFGYESLIDAGPSPVTATTRERTLLLVLPQNAFERLFGGEESESRVFLDVIHRDLMAALRQALRPHARLASSV
jgi:CRP/FNR family transcriptional regulator, cyclic AMP receptor protein